MSLAVNSAAIKIQLSRVLNPVAAEEKYRTPLAKASVELSWQNICVPFKH